MKVSILLHSILVVSLITAITIASGVARAGSFYPEDLPEGFERWRYIQEVCGSEPERRNSVEQTVFKQKSGVVADFVFVYRTKYALAHPFMIRWQKKELQNGGSTVIKDEIYYFDRVWINFEGTEEATKDEKKLALRIFAREEVDEKELAKCEPGTPLPQFNKESAPPFIK